MDGNLEKADKVAFFGSMSGYNERLDRGDSIRSDNKTVHW
jgi:hypothetical protein